MFLQPSSTVILGLQTSGLWGDVEVPRLWGLHLCFLLPRAQLLPFPCWVVFSIGWSPFVLEKNKEKNVLWSCVPLLKCLYTSFLWNSSEVLEADFFFHPFVMYRCSSCKSLLTISWFSVVLHQNGFQFLRTCFLSLATMISLILQPHMFLFPLGVQQ